MQISELKEGMHVSCPPDRGAVGYRGKVENISKDINTNYQGVEYVWVTVREFGYEKYAHVWPSNRLAKA